MASSESLIESAKRAAAYAAVDAYIKPEYKRIGIGSGAWSVASALTQARRFRTPWNVLPHKAKQQTRDAGLFLRVFNQNT
jgi:hypothetical protein